MKILKKVKRKPRATLNPKKEAVFKELVSFLQDSGYDVRREKLRQGHGWRASSGSCKALGDRLIFVDSRLSQDEQISFVLGRICDLAIELDRQRVQALPERIRQQLIVPEQIVE